MALASLAPPTAAASLALVLAGCDPLVTLVHDDDKTTATATTSTASDGETTSTDDDATTAGDDESSTTSGAMPPDLGDPGPSFCPAGAGDLALEWTVDAPAAQRADSLAAGAGLVAWTSGEWGDSRLQVLDVDGNPQWEQTLPLVSGEATDSLEDLAIDPDGNMLRAGTVEGDGFDGLFYAYDRRGNPIAEDVYSTPDRDAWWGIARLSGGDVVLAGETDGVMLVRRQDPGGAEQWSRTFAESGAEWATDVAVGPSDVIFVSGFSNMIAGPVVQAYDANGELLWSHVDAEDGFEYAASVAADSQGGAWLTVQEVGEHRVQRFDPAGSVVLTIPLDFHPYEVAIDIDDSVVVAGGIPSEKLVVVERYASNGSLLARYERTGRFAVSVAVDEQCHAYVVGFDNGPGAWLDKLR
jgi:hypothetical protein